MAVQLRDGAARRETAPQIAKETMLAGPALAAAMEARTKIPAPIVVPTPVEYGVQAGGWETVPMVEEVYTQADEETTLNVALHEGRVREAK